LSTEADAQNKNISKLSCGGWLMAPWNTRL